MAETLNKENVTVVEAQGGIYKLGVMRGDVAHVEVVDVDFVLFLKNGTRIVLVNAAMDAMSDHPSNVQFADGSAVSIVSLMDEVGNINIGDTPVAAMSSILPFEKSDAEKQLKDANSSSDQQDSEYQNQQAEKILAEGLAPTNAEPVTDVVQQMIQQGTSDAIPQPPASNVIIVIPSPIAPPPTPPSPPSTPPLSFTPVLLVDIFNFVQQGQSGNVFYGGGGDSSTDPTDPLIGYSSYAASPGAQMKAESLSGTPGADVIYSDYSAYLGGDFAKLLHFQLAGLFTSLDTLTVSGIPPGWSLALIAPNGNVQILSDGVTLTLPSGFVNGNAFDIKLVYQTYDADPANPVHVGPLDIQFTVGVTDTNGVLFNISNTMHLAVADAVSPSDLSYVDANGQTVTILPAQGNPDYVLAGAGDDTVYAGLGHDTVFGEAGNDLLYGEGGNDILDGGIGADTLIGGAGDDTYVVDSALDVVTENLNEGTDTVRAGVDYTLGANVENLVLTGTAAISGTGNTLDNILTGNTAANTLDGGIGADTLIGGAGDDTYVVDSALDVVTENLNEGTDTVRAGVDYTLGANIENLVLTGIAAINGTGNTLDNILTGNTAANTLDGGVGADTLDGGVGADTLIGGAGDDIYVVDNILDVVTENLNEGTDTVQAGVGYTLGANVENLVLTGTAVINGTGNTLDNILTGNTAANTLDGGIGADTLIGGAGDDTYVVDNILDVVTENFNEGTDTVRAGVDYTLGANIENLVLTGTTAITGTGNSLNNTLTGNVLNNILVGGAGDDVLIGGMGADVLIGGIDYLDSAGGNDWVSYVGSAAVTVDLTDTTPLDGLADSTGKGGDAEGDSYYYINNLIGSDGNDILFGNSANNTIIGGAGNDTLDGGGGTDVLNGGTGIDKVSFLNLAAGLGVSLNSAGGANITATVGANPLTWDIVTLMNVEIFEGSNYDDVMTGGDGSDTFYGMGGNDTLDGGYGSDYLDGGLLGSDSVSFASLGTNGVTITIDAIDPNVAYATASNLAGTGTDTDTLINIENITGGAGNDFINGSDANNFFSGGAGNDSLYGFAGNDTLVGGLGDDFIDGGIGDDVIYGDLLSLAPDPGDGADTLLGGDGNDTLYGGGSNDTLDGGAGADTMDGGDGLDWASYQSSVVGVVAALDPALATNTGDAAGDTYNAIENLLGSNASDTLYGDGFDNVIDGAAGVDTLYGSGGNDTLFGGSGNDTLYGGNGDDTLVGGAGVDVLDGGLGNNWASYETSAGLVVALDSLLATNTGDAAGDTYINIQNLLGSDGADTLYGDSGKNTIIGGLGNDTLDGGGGIDDLLDGGADIDKVSFASLVGSGVMLNSGGGADVIATTVSGTATLRNIEIFEGSNNDDVMTGGSGADTFFGLGGNDILDGGYGSDYLDGGAGNDSVNFAGLGFNGVTITIDSIDPNKAYAVASNLAGTGTDSDILISIENITGGAGNDTITGSSADNVFWGAGGNDTLVGGLGSDTLHGGDGNDVIYGDLLSAFTANTTSASDGADTLFGDAGDDTLHGAGGDDVLEGGSGADKLYGGAGNNWASYTGSVGGVTVNLITGAGSSGDALGDTYNSIQNLIGSSGNDMLIGDSGVNILKGGAADDILDGSAGADTLYGEDGNDTLVGGLGNDTLIGGLGSDTADYSSATGVLTITLDINGDAVGISDGLLGTDRLLGIENIVGGVNNDILTGNSAVNTLTGGLGNDTLAGGLGADVLIGGISTTTGSGSDWASYAGSAAVTVNLATGVTSGGDAAGDTFYFIDNLLGSANADDLTGNANVNTLIGGLGNDTLAGGAGADVLIGGTSTSVGSGSDWASYVGSTAVTVDLTDVNVVGGDGRADADGQGGDAAGDSYYYISNLLGGSGNDTLTGNDNVNVLNGGAGDDTLVGAGGGDTLMGGTGNDTLVGGLGNDILYGGDSIADSGSDTADYSSATVSLVTTLGADGISVSDGLGGTDQLFGIENLIGGIYADTLTGNLSNNTLYGGAGNDTLVGGGGNNYLDGGADVDKVDYSGLTGSVVMTAGLGGTATATLALASGVSTDTLANIEIIVGSIYNDVLVGTSGDNTLYGYVGVDTLIGGAGADVLVGGVNEVDPINANGGSDWASYVGSTAVTVNLTDLTGALGIPDGKADTTGLGGDAQGDSYYFINNLMGSANNDTLTGNANINILDGGTGDDMLFGAAGLDTLRGGLGNDTLIGGADADVLIGGTSTADALGGSDWASYAGSTAVTVDLTDVNVVGGDGLADATGVGGDAQGDSYYYINNLLGSANNDTLTGNANANVLDGGAGDDTLMGAAGNDTLLGGAGNDYLVGGAGSNYLDGGADFDTVDYSGIAAGVVMTANADGTATAIIGGGISTDTLTNIENILGSNNDDILAGTSGDNTLIGGLGNDTLIGGAGADVLIGGISTTVGSGSDWASYVGSMLAVTVDLTDVLPGPPDGRADATGLGGDAQGDSYYFINNLMGSANNDTLTGNANINILDGGAGDDMLFGAAGLDTLRGGLGNDTLIGGADADVLIGGTSTADALGGSDWASYAGSTAVTVDLTDVNVVGGDGLADATGVGGDAQGDSYYYINNLLGSANNDTLTGNANANVLDGGAGDDILLGGAGNDTLIGGLGNDTLTGGLGNDTADYSSATGALTIALDVNGDAVGISDGLLGTDQLFGIEDIVGGINNDTLIGNLNANILDGGAGNDKLVGGGGGDSLTGGAGDDTLVGGAGADILIGGLSTAVGSGNDWASYEGSLAVTVDLATGASSGGDAAGDIFYFISNLIGSDNDDTLTGNASVNTLIGGLGNDTLMSGLGADVLIGGISTAVGGGSDWVSYAGSTAVIVNLAGTGSGGDAAGDTYYFIDNVMGSSFADILTGNLNSNTLVGGKGNDTLVGGGGADILIGGVDTWDSVGGNDWVSYAGSAAVTVSLVGVGSGSGGDAAGDTFYFISNLLGSANNDTLTGNAITNTLAGGVGDDTLIGGAGADVLIGGISTTDALGGNDWASYVGSLAVTIDLGAGTALGGDAQGDTYYYINNLMGSDNGDILSGNASINILNGGVGDDTLFGANGNDTLLGGAGNDTLVGGVGADTLIGGASATDNLGGSDWASYANSAAVIVNLIDTNADGKADVNGMGSEAAGDSYYYINNLLGSNFGDTLTGNENANTLLGGFGDDYLADGDRTVGVADVLDGGAGVDFADYSSWNGGGGFIFDRSHWINSSIQVQLDTLISIEGLVGTQYDDTFYSNASMGDTFQGGLGNDTFYMDSSAAFIDTIDGGGGANMVSYKFDPFTHTANTTPMALTSSGTFLYGASSDRFANIQLWELSGGNDSFSATTVQAWEIWAGAGNDFITGNAGANAIYGEAGNDSLTGAGGADRLYGGEGADILAVTKTELTSIAVIDGGAVDASIDTLNITGIGASTLALSSFDAKVTSIEKLDILDGVNSTIALNGADIRAMVDSGNASKLLIRMDSGDTLSFSLAAGETVSSAFSLGTTHYVFTDAALATATLDFVTA